MLHIELLKIEINEIDSNGIAELIKIELVTWNRKSFVVA